METKDLFTIVIVSLIVSILAVVYVPNFIPKSQNLGGNTIHPLIEDFVAGIKVNGNTLVDGDRAITAVSATLTGDVTVTDELNLGTSVSNPGCIKFYTTNGLAYIYGVTTSANGTMVVTTTKPSVCP